jgi:pimeloyl-ACP methyl ester carboxylesterase
VHGGAQNAMLVSGQKHTAMDVLALLDRREVPVLVVSGGKDVTVNRAAAKEMRQAAPSARYVHIPDACHAGMVGKREKVKEALADFFRLERETNEFNKRRLLEATGMQSKPGSPAKVR